MQPLEKLAKLFEQFPGIGKRQAKRFVYFILHKNQAYLQELIEEMQKVKNEIHQCKSCYRFYPKNGKNICEICAEENRSKQILIVEKDADLEKIHTSKLYEGKYFVLGGFIASHEKRKNYARTEELFRRIREDREKGILEEVIFGLSVSPEAEHTRLHLSSLLKKEFPDLQISTLGRGLSTGTELEYSDNETLKYAFQSRIKEQ